MTLSLDIQMQIPRQIMRWLAWSVVFMTVCRTANPMCNYPRTKEAIIIEFRICMRRITAMFHFNTVQFVCKFCICNWDFAYTYLKYRDSIISEISLDIICLMNINVQMIHGNVLCLSMPYFMSMVTERSHLCWQSFHFCRTHSHKQHSAKAKYILVCSLW